MNHLYEICRKVLRAPLMSGMGLCLIVTAFASSQSAFGQSRRGDRTDTVECKSSNNARKVCPAKAQIAGIRVIEKISKSPCAQGTSYGIAGNAIWVDKGCSARFEVTYKGDAPATVGPAPIRPDRPGNSDRDEVASLSCASENNRRNNCRAGGEIRSVKITRQRSKVRCREGVNYGFRNDSIWVDNGCAADFEVRFRSGNSQGNNRPQNKPGYGQGSNNNNRPDNRPGTSQQNETIRLACKSTDYRHEECSVPGTVVSLSLLEKKSQSACSKDSSYGYRDNYVWVDRGCEAVFQVTYNAGRNSGLGNSGSGSQTRDIACKSTDYKRNECFAGGRITDLRIKKNRSKTKCQPNINYGYRDNTIWVDKGCEADFEVTYRSR